MLWHAIPSRSVFVFVFVHVVDIGNGLTEIHFLSICENLLSARPDPIRNGLYEFLLYRVEPSDKFSLTILFRGGTNFKHTFTNSQTEKVAGRGVQGLQG